MPVKAMVSGAAGFVGRHMVQALLDRGWTAGRTDIAWGADVLDVFRQDESDVFDLVVHAAAHVGGRADIDGNVHNLARNLELDAAMFSWAARTKQPRIVYLSSSAVYPRIVQEREYIESLSPDTDISLYEDLIELDAELMAVPDADYGWAKLCGERLAANARKAGLNVHVIRPFSGYGQDQDTTYPFPAIVARARKGDLTVWGPPGQTRDFIHIDDVIGGILAIVDADVQEPVNLCTGVGTELGELACRIRHETMFPGEQFDRAEFHACYDESKPTGVFHRVGDPTRMLQYYTPKITLEEGIRRALAA